MKRTYLALVLILAIFIGSIVQGQSPSGPPPYRPPGRPPISNAVCLATIDLIDSKINHIMAEITYQDSTGHTRIYVLGAWMDMSVWRAESMAVVDYWTAEKTTLIALIP